jgi:hypothetical protein
MPIPKSAANAAEFLASVARDWGARVSGGFTVPFTIAGFLTQRDYQQIIWWGMAAAALLVSYYLDHRKQKARIEELEKKLRPNLKLSFDMTDPHCVRRDVQLKDGHKGDWYRLKVESASNVNVEHCSARLLDIYCGDSPIFAGETARLSFALSNNPFDVTVNAKIPALIDLLVAKDNNQLYLAFPTADGSGSIDLKNLFSLSGDYTIRVAVTSASTVTVVAKLLLQWSLDRAKAKLLWLGRE